MNTRTLILGCVLMAAVGGGASAHPKLKDYKGPDGGWLVFSVSLSANPTYPAADVDFRRIGERDGDEASARPNQWGGHKDAVSNSLNPGIRAAVEQAGLSLVTQTSEVVVFSLRLQPGRYEIYKILVTGMDGGRVAGQQFDQHAMPFSIEPNRTTYAGELSFVSILQRGLLGPHFHGWAMFTTDRRDRDIPIARQRSPGLESDRGAAIPSGDGAPTGAAP